MPSLLVFLAVFQVFIAAFADEATPLPTPPGGIPQLNPLNPVNPLFPGINTPPANGLNPIPPVSLTPPFPPGPLPSPLPTPAGGVGVMPLGAVSVNPGGINQPPNGINGVPSPFGAPVGNPISIPNAPNTK